MKSILTSVLFGIFAVVSPVAAGEPKAASKDIVDTALAAGLFKTVAAALGAANLVETMKGAGPFTVLHPPADSPH